MSDNKHLVFAILKYLDEQRSQLTDDAAESLEVAQQCLETAYGVSLEDEQTYPLPGNLLEIFEHGMKQMTAAKPEVTPEQKEHAEKYKNEGNDFMRQEKYSDALGCYTKAIEVDGSNAVYFCNRAAAYSKLNQNEDALSDCMQAIQLDPKYGKAFGRKGLAHSALNQHKEAKECYLKALELDPENQSYQQNLEVAEQKLCQTPPNLPGVGGLNLGGMDFSGLLNNPALMNMATTMLQNPQMQNMMSNMMAGSQGQGAPGAGPEGIGGLLNAGQQLAQQMQQSNPELVEQLRQQMQQDQPPPGSEEQ